MLIGQGRDISKKLTDSPRLPGLPTDPEGPAGPGAPASPPAPAGPGSPRSPWGGVANTGQSDGRVCACVCWWVAETYGKAKLQRRYLDSSSTGASRGSIVTSVALKTGEHWLSQSPLRRTKRSNFCRWWLAEYSPHGQPLPEVQSYQADQCFREDHGVQKNQQVQVYQARPVIGHRVGLSFLPWDSSLSRVLTGLVRPYVPNLQGHRGNHDLL